MTDRYPPSKQRAALLPMLEALNASPSALRRDECGDPRIDGRWGHIYAVLGVPEAGLDQGGAGSKR